MIVSEMELFGGERVGSVEEEEDDVGLLCLLVGADDGGLFEGVGGGVDAGGIDEGDGEGGPAISEDRLGVDPVAGGAGGVGGDGDGAAEERVGEGAFSGVGRADNSDAWRDEEVAKGAGAVEEPLSGGVESPEVVGGFVGKPLLLLTGPGGEAFGGLGG